MTVNLKKLLDFWDSGWTSNKNDLVDVGFVELGVPQRPLDGVHGAAEQVGVQLFETSPSDGSVKVDSLEWKKTVILGYNDHW